MWAAVGSKLIYFCLTIHEWHLALPLIIETSLAPSPMAKVTAFLALFINSTTKAFCNGVTLQQITDLHCEAISRNLEYIYFVFNVWD